MIKYSIFLLFTIVSLIQWSPSLFWSSQTWQPMPAVTYAVCMMPEINVANDIMTDRQTSMIKHLYCNITKHQHTLQSVTACMLDNTVPALQTGANAAIQNPVSCSRINCACKDSDKRQKTHSDFVGCILSSNNTKQHVLLWKGQWLPRQPWVIVRAVRIELFTARVLYRVSYRVLDGYDTIRYASVCLTCSKKCWKPEVAIDHRVVRNKPIPGSSFKFVI